MEITCQAKRTGIDHPKVAAQVEEHRQESLTGRNDFTSLLIEKTRQLFFEIKAQTTIIQTGVAQLVKRPRLKPASMLLNNLKI